MAYEMMTAEFVAMVGGMFISFFIGSLVFFGMTPIFAVGEGVFIAVAGTINAIILARLLVSNLSLNALVIIPALIGALTFTRLTKYRWAARYPIAILSGVGAGVIFGPQIKSMILASISDTVLGVLTGTPDPIAAWLTFIPMVVTPLAFTYSMKYSNWLHTGPLRHLFTLGRTFFLIFVGGRMGELAGTSLSDYLPAWAIAYVKRPIVAIQDYMAGRLVLT
jgi:hypothetical protein